MADASGFHAISPVLKSTSVMAVPSANSTSSGQTVQEWTWNSSSYMQWSIGLAN